MANKFWVGGTGTWDASDTTHWSDSDGGAGSAVVPGSGDAVIFNANSGTGTITVNATINVTSITMGALTGPSTLDFATNNNNVTLQTFSCTGSGNRTLNMGNGTWTITGTTGTLWDCTTFTNLTLNSNSSTLTFAATATGLRSILLGGKTYNAIVINDTALRSTALGFNQAGTITTLTVTSLRWLQISGSITLTITNGLTWNGTSSSPIIFECNTTSGTAGTISAGGAIALSWCAIKNITKSGAGSITATNSFDFGNNTSVTITAPSAGAGGGLIAHPGLSGGFV